MEREEKGRGRGLAPEKILAQPLQITNRGNCQLNVCYYLKLLRI